MASIGSDFNRIHEEKLMSIYTNMIVREYFHKMINYMPN